MENDAVTKKDRGKCEEGSTGQNQQGKAGEKGKSNGQMGVDGAQMCDAEFGWLTDPLHNSSEFSSWLSLQAVCHSTHSLF